jgi:hypothetical protein
MNIETLILELNKIPKDHHHKELVCISGFRIDQEGIEHNIESTISEIKYYYPMNDICYFELEEI